MDGVGTTGMVKELGKIIQPLIMDWLLLKMLKNHRIIGRKGSRLRSDERVPTQLMGLELLFGCNGLEQRGERD